MLGPVLEGGAADLWLGCVGQSVKSALSLCLLTLSVLFSEVESGRRQSLTCRTLQDFFWGCVWFMLSDNGTMLF